MNPITLTEYSLFSRITSSTSTKSHLRRKIQHFSGKDTDKNAVPNAQKRDFKCEIFFLGMGHSALPTSHRNPLDHSKLSGSALTFPQNDNQIYATVASP